MIARPHDGLALDAAVCTRRPCRQLCDLAGATFGRHDGFMPRLGMHPLSAQPPTAAGGAGCSAAGENRVTVVAPEQLRDLAVATIRPHVGLKSCPGTPPLSAHPTEDTCGDGCTEGNDRGLAV
eukprot:4913554-Prymnesium_polylepis.1